MTIDIIDYTNEQFAALSAEKLEKVREAQVKKNKLLLALEERLSKLKSRLIDRGVYPSTLYSKRAAELTAQTQTEIEWLREALLFYLRYATNSGMSGDTTAPDDLPYTVDYALSEEERMVIVRTYYMNTYTDGAERFAAFQADTFAKTYLGELYAPLYYYIQDYA